MLFLRKDFFFDLIQVIDFLINVANFIISLF